MSNQKECWPTDKHWAWLAIAALPVAVLAWYLYERTDRVAGLIAAVLIVGFCSGRAYGGALIRKRLSSKST